VTAVTKESAPDLRWLDLTIKVAGVVIATLLGVATGLFEAFWAPLRLGGHRVPLVAVAALVLNPLLVWLAYWTSGRRLAALGPGLGWLVVMLAGAGRTTEGDLVLAGDNWVGLLTITTGSLAFGLAGYRLILAGGPRPRPAPPRSD